MDSNHHQPDGDLAVLPSRTEECVITGQVSAAAGRPLPGATVTLIDRAGRQISAGVADETGRYRLSPPEPDEYILICAHPTHHPHAARITVFHPRSTQDLVLSGAGTLTGRVLRKSRTGDTPVPGVLIALSDATGRVVETSTSDSAGEYAMAGLTEGSYTLTAGPVGCEPTATGVHIVAGQSSEWNLTLSDRTELTGVVRSTVTGAPLAEAMVNLVNGDGEIVATGRTDTEGRFGFTDIPADDSYTLTASGYPPIAFATPLEPATPRHITVRLGPQ